MWPGVEQTIAKYLARGAEPEANSAASIEGRYHSVLTIPVRDEGVEFFDGLLPALSARPGALVIVVVNADPASAAAVLEANQRLLDALRERGAVTPIDPGIERVAHRHATLLLVDRTSPGRQLPAKQGVGLARKIGCDLALGLWRAGAVTSPWLFSTDADVTLPPNYFDVAAAAKPAVGALLFEFDHRPSGEPALDRATFEYESYLRYYTLGLAWAKSPYAFHTLGSCLSIHAQAYAAVRGFPKREAGEDFHLLSKVAKITGVQSLHEPRIAIASRRSLRTPFGTGARVESTLAGKAVGFHDPRLFALLRAVHQSLHRWATEPGGDRLAMPGDTDEGLWAVAASVLGELDLAALLSHAARVGRDADDRLLHLHTGFDALKTLRLLRAVEQRAGLVTLDHGRALQQAPFVALPAGQATDLPQALELLRRLSRSGPALMGLPLGLDSSL